MAAMTNLVEIDLDSLTAVQLRKLGAENGYKGANKARKADLLDYLAPIRDEQIKLSVAETSARLSQDEPVVVQEAKAAERFDIPQEKAITIERSDIPKGKCKICGTRPRMQLVRMQQKYGVSFPYCEPCLNKADWQNTHSDYGHDIDGTEVEPCGQYEAGHKVKGCWICHPELDKSDEDYRPRQGIERKGQVIHALGGRDDKALVVETVAIAAGFVTSKVVADGHLVLSLLGDDSKMVLVWDGKDRYVYSGSSYQNGTANRRVRNVSEALRLLSSK